MWEMAIQHALMPAVSTGVSHNSHCSGGHSKRRSATLRVNVLISADVAVRDLVDESEWEKFKSPRMVFHNSTEIKLM